MTRIDLIETVKKHGGEWKPTKKLTFTLNKEDEAQVQIHHENGIAGALWEHHESVEDIFITSNKNIMHAHLLMEFARSVAAVFSIKLPDEKIASVTEVEVIKDADKTNEHKLQGMVDAYEKILIGRAITAS